MLEQSGVRALLVLFEDPHAEVINERGWNKTNTLGGQSENDRIRKNDSKKILSGNCRDMFAWLFEHPRNGLYAKHVTLADEALRR